MGIPPARNLTPHLKVYRSSLVGSANMLSDPQDLILLTILIVLLGSALPTWPYNARSRHRAWEQWRGPERTIPHVIHR
jgi:hypothetical protein